MTAATLPDAPWRHGRGMDHLLEVIGAADGQSRYVGGAVRDSLLGQAVKDVDIATVHEPAETIRRLTEGGIKAVPTGIDHGTVTAVLPDGSPIEITTLRQDVATDGRRATIAFTRDWSRDASRRDFTINALYADPLSGEVLDFFGGIDDLAAGRVRFIGEAEDRIAEDHLRILRFFRFFARFGRGEPDRAAYAACVAHANSLMALSRERIADELVKLLALPDPAPSLRLMVAGGIWRPVIPEFSAQGVESLAGLITREAAAGIDGAPVRRLCALLPPDPAVAEAVGARLKLSNKARKRMVQALAPVRGMSSRELVFRFGNEAAVDMLLLDPGSVPTAVREARAYVPPTLPFTGGTLIDMGLEPGPDVARALAAIRDQWIAEDFPDTARAQAIAAQIVSKFQRARQ